MSVKYSELNLGQIEALVNKLGGMEGALRFLAGMSEIVVKKHVVDLDRDPLIPYEGWKVESHKKGGQLEWSPAKVALYFSKNQAKGKSIEGHKLRKELEEIACENANLLDYLLDNPHLIPEEWKKDAEGNTLFTYFWGTIYRDSGGDLCVRCLCFRGGHWQARYGYLGYDWGFRSPALRRAS